MCQSEWQSRVPAPAADNQSRRDRAATELNESWCGRITTTLEIESGGDTPLGLAVCRDLQNDIDEPLSSISPSNVTHQFRARTEVK